jgi:regulator of protease activity HflC (stomatin/prohibitin superfamily)
VATQDALAARQKVEQSKAEAQQEIERARGQAQAQRLRASALTDRNLQFEALQILKEAPPQIVFLPAGQGNLLDPSTFLKSAPSTP